MTGKDAILYSLQASSGMLKSYLGDLSDSDFTARPVPNANHIAWQLGHLIASEIKLIKHEVHAVTYPTLPAGFAETHGPKNNTADDGFLTKDEYIALFDKVRNVTLAAARGLPDGEFDRPTEGPMASYAPNLGTLFLLISQHDLMHAGQFTPIRRKLGKPVLF